MMPCLVLGTRPEIIKMAPVIRELGAREIPFRLVHTGQHYSPDLDGVFFDDLGLPPPDINLGVGSGTHAEETAGIMVGVERALLKGGADITLVLGDTNSTLGGALAAAKLHVPLGHIEAGLRSHDRRMPEEINRVLTDHCSDFLFPPTPNAEHGLLAEGIDAEKMRTTGNTIVDAVEQSIAIARERSTILEELRLEPSSYLLATAHRHENVDDRTKLAVIMEGLGRVAARLDLPIVCPLHPRTKNRLGEFGLSVPQGVMVTEPLGYLDFLHLEAHARIVLTDSGGIQEEACILGVPCVTFRDNTERPETLEVGSNVLAGTDPERMVECARNMLKAAGGWTNPFGDGKAAGRIVDSLFDGSWLHK
ncbi:MAG: UDP-N-acetylglucosamine 2-epimerase (non-hydrolyzing) [Candidatus Undinarchaeales archaeon]|nr:UDP-N-acetylglucosamine 2-epimerase (non-hydrolyzing) [Candidatus Undinarchaeales archaeon]